MGSTEEKMSLPQTFEGRRQAARRSRLVPVGAALVALAYIAPLPLSRAAMEMGGLARSLALIATDVFRAGFFIGIACLVIGGLRNRRWRREAKEADRAAAPSP
jgi:hypothetical protein